MPALECIQSFTLYILFETIPMNINYNYLPSYTLGGALGAVVRNNAGSVPN